MRATTQASCGPDPPACKKCLPTQPCSVVRMRPVTPWLRRRLHVVVDQVHGRPEGAAGRCSCVAWRGVVWWCGGAVAVLAGDMEHPKSDQDCAELILNSCLVATLALW